MCSCKGIQQFPMQGPHYVFIFAQQFLTKPHTYINIGDKTPIHSEISIANDWKCVTNCYTTPAFADPVPMTKLEIR